MSTDNRRLRYRTIVTEPEDGESVDFSKTITCEATLLKSAHDMNTCLWAGYSQQTRLSATFEMSFTLY